MNSPDLMILLAHGGLGTGIAIGLSSGLVTGLLFGAAAGAAFASKKIGRQLTATIESGEISVVDKNAHQLTSESICALLNERFNKV